MHTDTSTAMLRRPLIPVGELETTHAIASHPQGSDVAVLERYHKALKEGRLSIEALLFYGQLLERTDTKYLPDFAVAITEALGRHPELEKRITLRPRLTLDQLHEYCSEIRERVRDFLQGVGEGLREQFNLVEGPEFAHHLARLDAPCSAST